MSNEIPGEVKHPTIRFVKPVPDYEVERGYTRQNYRIYWCPEYPMDKLGYGGHRPLWRYRGEHAWRSALYEDIARRGQINPCLVWNHRAMGYNTEGWSYYVKVGRNKTWAMKALGFETCKILLCADEPPEHCGSTEITPDCILDYWKDGHLNIHKRGMFSVRCTDPAKCEMPEE